MRLPFGAVRPAIKPATGFFMLALIHLAASTSSVPPISPIMTTPSVSGSLLKSSSASMNPRPRTGSPPMPTQVDWPMPRCEVCQTAS